MRWACVPIFAGLAAVMALWAAPALAAEGPWWHVGVGSRPSVLARGAEGEIVVSVENLGDAATVIEHGGGAATPVVIADSLPAGVEVVGGGVGVAGTQPKPGGDPTETVRAVLLGIGVARLLRIENPAGPLRSAGSPHQGAGAGHGRCDGGT